MVEGLEGCHSANISPDNRTLWVPALKQDRICLFTLTDDGHLEPQTPAEVTTVAGAGPRHMVFHPSKPFAYCVNELNSSGGCVGAERSAPAISNACRRWI
ncbi:6-phosphogluconolactonase [Cronobacter sakazakii]|nr:6-phosphogluconolactonase [Cronobacter sakazakii]